MPTLVCSRLFLCLAMWSAVPFAIAQTAAETFRQFAEQEVGTFALDQSNLDFEITERRRDGRYEVVRGIVTEPGGVDRFVLRNMTLVLDYQTETMVGLVDLYNRSLTFTADGVRRKQGKNGLSAPSPLDCGGAPLLATNHFTKQNAAEPLAEIGERDQEGRIVIDVLVGFSDQAAAAVGDPDREALMLVETVNTCLLNSQVEDITVRLVGTATHPANPGIVTSALDDGLAWFADEIEALAPDLIALMQLPTDAPGGAGGWAGVGDQISVNGAMWSTVLRHEIGHNVGASHCRGEGDRGYNFGYPTDALFGGGSAMCGNSISIYSTPEVFDLTGRPFGVADAQDVTRVWREQAAAISARRLHTVPFAGEPPRSLHFEAEDYQNAFDSTPGNHYGAYRDGDVDIRPHFQGDGYYVDWFSSGESLIYAVPTETAARATVSMRVSARHPYGLAIILANDKPLQSLAIPQTDGLWQTISTEIALPAGTQTLTVAAYVGWFAFDWLELDLTYETPPNPINANAR